MPRGDRYDPGSASPPPRYTGTFLLALREALGRLGWKLGGWRGHLLECVGDDGRHHLVGLDSVYRQARRSTPREQWPDLIAEFLSTIAAAADDDEAGPLPDDLESVADQLLVQIEPASRTPPEGIEVWSQPLEGTDLLVRLVIDYPDRITYVPVELVEESGRPGSAWLERALENLAASSPSDCLEDPEEDTGIRLCAVEDGYDAARALVLDRLLPGLGADGFFVAIPTRDQLLVREINVSGVEHVHLMKVYAEEQHQASPGPISPEVYWVRGGRWHTFGVKVEEDGINVNAPDEFLDILRRLKAERDGPGKGRGKKRK